MAAIVNEGTQYLDIGGVPLTGGEIFIGLVNADPVANPKDIFSDRELQSPLTNPQPIDDFGRSVNKIWTDGKFSIQVNNSAIPGVQQFQDLDAGESTTGATSISLSSIVGSNTITASGGITAYTSNQQFVFRTALANTGDVTLNVDSIGSKPVVKNKNQAINPGEFEINQTVIVVYNAINDNFEWTNQNNKVVDFYTGTTVASASTTDIWESTDGNAVHITGAVNITSFGTAPNIGARKTIIFDGTPLISDGASLILRGGLDFTAGVNDILEVFANTTTQFIVDTPTRLPSGHLFNLNTANGDGAGGGDQAHDITAQPGDAAAENNAGDLAISSSLTKQIDANFAAGNNAGGLADTLTVANSTWYHVFIVDLTAGGADIGFDTNLNASLLLASTGVGTKFRRIGSVLTDGSANIFAFLQTGDNFDWIEPADHKFINTTTNTASTGQRLTADVPLGAKVRATISAVLDGAGAGVGLYFYDPDQYASATPTINADATTGNISLVSNANAIGSQIQVMTDTVSRIGWVADASGRSADALVVGWSDTRGRDD